MLKLQVIDRLFLNMHEIISYYMINSLHNNTSLTKLPPKESIKEVISLFKFNAEEQDDLSFNEHEEMTIIRKLDDEEGWGVAKNALGIIGMIPYNYVVDVRFPLLIFYNSEAKLSCVFRNVSMNHLLKLVNLDRLYRDVQSYQRLQEFNMLDGRTYIILMN